MPFNGFDFGPAALDHTFGRFHVLALERRGKRKPVAPILEL